MTIEKRAQHVGVDVHFDPDECELFMKLALDAEKANGGADAPVMYTVAAQSYFSLSLTLGKKFRALAQAESTLLRHASDTRSLTRAMVDLALGAGYPDRCTSSDQIRHVGAVS